MPPRPAPSLKLALEGGPKAVTTPWTVGPPKIDHRELLALARRFGYSPAVLRRLRSLLQHNPPRVHPYLGSYLSDLPDTSLNAFERKACRVFRSKYAIGVSSGTGALHAALVAAGVGPGTEVIIPAVGFIATPAAVVMAKAVPIFCDVDHSLAIDPAKIESLITPRTVAIIPTHIMGSVCDMRAVMRVARRHNLVVIEDAAESTGARFKGRHVGTIGHIGIFSISAYKIVGGGEGGLLLTRSRRLYERARQLVECTGLWRPDRFAPPRYPGELFCGTNYRMSELEAAVDVVQLDKMESVVNRFRRVNRRILSRLRRFREITPQKLNDPAGEVGYRIRFFPESFDLAAKIVPALKAEGIPARTRGPNAKPNWHIYSLMFPLTLAQGPTPDNCPFECPIYLQRGGSASYSRGDCPVADDLFARVVSIDLNQWFSARDCDSVAHGINKVLSAYCTPLPGPLGWL